MFLEVVLRINDSAVYLYAYMYNIIIMNSGNQERSQSVIVIFLSGAT